MSEKLIIPHVLTASRPWGVQVEWKWPEGSHWFSKLEMQCLYSDGRLEKQVIAWPVTATSIGGLKAGELLQIRLRPIDKDGSASEWRLSNWIEGVSSIDAADYLGVINAPFTPCGAGEVFINNAFIKATKHQQPVADSSHTLSVNIESILKNVMESTASAAAKQEEAMSDLRKLIDKSIEESIRLNCRPGGAIWKAIRRG